MLNAMMSASYKNFFIAALLNIDIQNQFQNIMTSHEHENPKLSPAAARTFSEPLPRLQLFDVLGPQVTQSFK